MRSTNISQGAALFFTALFVVCLLLSSHDYVFIGALTTGTTHLQVSLQSIVSYPAEDTTWRVVLSKQYSSRVPH